MALSYTLVSLAGTAVMAHLLLLLYRATRIRKSQQKLLIKTSNLVTSLSHLLAAIVLTAYVLYPEQKLRLLCRALEILSSVSIFWILISVSANAWLHFASHVQKLRNYDVTRSKRLFAIVISVSFAFTLIISLSQIALWTDKDAVYILSCSSVQISPFSGKAFAIFTATLMLLILLIPTILTPVTIVTSYTLDYDTSDVPKRSLFCLSDLIGWWIINVTIWHSLWYAGQSESRPHEWIVGFAAVATILCNAIFGAIWEYYVLHSSKQQNQRRGFMKLEKNCPKRLEEIVKMDEFRGDAKNYSTYNIQWLKSSKIRQAGELKVFNSDKQVLWWNEVNTISKLCAAEQHPNIVKYLWVSPGNCFSKELTKVTKESQSRHSSLTCLEYYPHGTLRQFLSDPPLGIDREILARGLTLDSAAGLRHLHSLAVVHNAIGVDSVYVHRTRKGYSALLGNFAHCTILPKTSALKINRKSDPLRELFSIDITGNSPYADDARCFANLIIELLAFIDERKSTKKRKFIGASKCRNRYKANQCISTCKCSSKVRDVRAHSHKTMTPNNKLFKALSLDSVSPFIPFSRESEIRSVSQQSFGNNSSCSKGIDNEGFTPDFTVDAAVEPSPESSQNLERPLEPIPEDNSLPRGMTVQEIIESNKEAQGEIVQTKNGRMRLITLSKPTVILVPADELSDSGESVAISRVNDSKSDTNYDVSSGAGTVTFPRTQRPVHHKYHQHRRTSYAAEETSIVSGDSGFVSVLTDKQQIYNSGSLASSDSVFTLPRMRSEDSLDNSAHYMKYAIKKACVCDHHMEAESVEHQVDNDVTLAVEAGSTRGRCDSVDAEIQVNTDSLQRNKHVERPRIPDYCSDLRPSEDSRIPMSELLYRAEEDEEKLFHMLQRLNRSHIERPVIHAEQDNPQVYHYLSSSHV